MLSSAPRRAAGSSRREPARRVHLGARLVAAYRKIHSPYFAIWLSLGLSGLVMAALLHVWTRLEIVRIGYALSEQTRIHQMLREHEQRLRLELASRKDPSAIERAARERLHMAPPDPTAIRVVKSTLPAPRRGQR